MKKKVLICTFSMGIGGMENFLKNVVEKIDYSKFEVFFAINQEPEDKRYIEILKKRGVKVFYVGNMRPNPIQYIKNIKKVLKNNGPFDVVHTNLEYQGSLVLYIAKKVGVKNLIAHSHTTNVSTRYNQLLMPIYRYMFKKNSTHRLACGVEAGKYMFGNDCEFEVIKNGIDVSLFIRSNIQKEELLKIGQIGRLSPEKNQIFSINLIKKLHEKGKKYHLYFLGDGVEKDRLLLEIKKLELLDYIHFMGTQEHIEKWYSQFDFVILPSFYEGVPFALLEAQCSGTFTFASENVAKESDLDLGLVSFTRLDLDIWTKKILDFRSSFVNNSVIENSFKNQGYDLNQVINRLEVIYES